VGAGPIGVEFADVFNAFGSQVTLIEIMPRILPLEDADSSSAIAKSFKKRGITCLAGAKVTKARVSEQGVALELEVNGKTQTLEAEKVLVAAGRALNLDGLGLEEAGVKRSDRGFVQVDEHLQTTAQGVYAIGDIAGPPMLAHKGSREGIMVAEWLAGRKPQPIRYDNIPSVTYCHPEVASIGLTEDQCKERRLDYAVGRFPFTASGRARATNETDGFVKILRDNKYGEILGAHIVASHASEMIHELALARANEYTVEEIELAVHAHPTLSEAIAEAALDSLDRVLHI
jgi:dihydrolipoamide dehydrogenase